MLTGPNINPASNSSILQGEYYQEELKSGITLCVLPRQVISWAEFAEYAPPYSIALDGFVDHGPIIDLTSKHANFDHHQGVNRLFTATTSLQVKRALRTGLSQAFKIDGQFRANIFVNDPDQDTALAVWLLTNLTNGMSEKERQRVRKLVEAEDLMDCTAGTYPVQGTRMFMEQMAWIFEPYSQARSLGKLHKLPAIEMANVIKAVGERISLYVQKQSQRLALDLRYINIGGGPGWALVEEQGADARTGIFRSGIQAFVACRRNSDSTFSYSIGRLSEFVDFPIKEIYELLNKVEVIASADLDRWGGSDLIGGSPRTRGSKLAPNQIEAIINHYLADRKALMFP